MLRNKHFPLVFIASVALFDFYNLFLFFFYHNDFVYPTTFEDAVVRPMEIFAVGLLFCLLFFVFSGRRFFYSWLIYIASWYLSFTFFIATQTPPYLTYPATSFRDIVVMYFMAILFVITGIFVLVWTAAPKNGSSQKETQITSKLKNEKRIVLVSLCVTSALSLLSVFLFLIFDSATHTFPILFSISLMYGHVLNIGGFGRHLVWLPLLFLPFAALASFHSDYAWRTWRNFLVLFFPVPLVCLYQLDHSFQGWLDITVLVDIYFFGLYVLATVGLFIYAASKGRNTSATTPAPVLYALAGCASITAAIWWILSLLKNF